MIFHDPFQIFLQAFRTFRIAVLIWALDLQEMEPGMLGDREDARIMSDRAEHFEFVFARVHIKRLLFLSIVSQESREHKEAGTRLPVTWVLGRLPRGRFNSAGPPP